MLKRSVMFASSAATSSVEAMLKSLRENPPSETAALVQAYRDVIALCKLPDDEYPYLYANYAIISPANAISEDISLQAAQACLTILEPKMRHGSIMHFTDMGQFYEEATRVAANAVAWIEGHRTEDADKLKEWLRVIDLGCQFVRPQDTYVVDTKVRLLLRAGRREEAFLVVHLNPTNHELDDIRREDDYIAWRTDYMARHPTLFSDEEKDFLRATEAVYTHMLTLRPDRRTRAGVGADVHARVPDMEELSKSEDHPLASNAAYASRFALLRGDVHLKGDLLTDEWNALMCDVLDDDDADGCIIEGNLTIDGDFIDTGAFEFIVGGNFACDYCFTKNGRLCVHGDADITYGMWGEYNDGDVEVNGTLRAPYVLSCDHAMSFKSDDGTRQVFISDYTRTTVGTFEEFSCGEHLFNPCVIANGEDSFTASLFMACVRRGENPFVTLPEDQKVAKRSRKEDATADDKKTS